ncbi:MAG: MEDS domain-containing protein [Deltaproteobacteria bacterium]
MKIHTSLENRMSEPKGDHICLIYDRDPLEQMPALIPFIKQGLKQGERFFYIADDLSPAQLHLVLKMNGIDPDAETRRGALEIWTKHEWIALGAVGDAQRAARLKRLIDDSLAAGFSGVRFAVEMTWTLGSDDIDAEKLERWEAEINSIFTPDVPAKIVCQYNRRKLPSSFVNQAFRTHPLAVVGDCFCGNPYYIHPSVTDDVSEIEWRLARLKEFRLDDYELPHASVEFPYMEQDGDSPNGDIVHIIGKKHAVFILNLLESNKTLRFGEIRDKFPKISPSTLSQRLDELEEGGLIERQMYAEIPPRVEYSPTLVGMRLLKTLRFFKKLSTPLD